MKTTTEMKLVPLDKLIPYANNARTHSPAQINKLRSSLREFGLQRMKVTAWSASAISATTCVSLWSNGA